MKTTIYYFTGTGNSLSIARKLADGLEGADIVPIAETTETVDRQDPRGECIGFVFPTYAYGLPRMVKEFAEAFSPSPGIYTFAVASCCGIPGPVLREFRSILKKNRARLNAGFAVLDPRSSLPEDPEKDPIQRIMIAANRGHYPAASEDRLPEIVETVRSWKDHSVESSNALTNFLGGLMHRLAGNVFPSSGKDFRTGPSCTGCGICTKICPRGNIRLNGEGRPEWGEDCEFCHACIQWCPNTAIEYKTVTEGMPRYRNPEVSLSDMTLRETVGETV